MHPPTELFETDPAEPRPATHPPTAPDADEHLAGGSFPRRTVRDVAVAAMSRLIPQPFPGELPAELRHVLPAPGDVAPPVSSLVQDLRTALEDPTSADAGLAALASAWPLTDVEVLAIALAAAVEEDPVLGRALARLQAPLAGSRPSLGLAARAFAPWASRPEDVLPDLFQGRAAQTGLLVVANDGLPLAERTLAVPPILCLALTGRAGHWPGVPIGVEQPIPIATSVRTEAARQAGALRENPGIGLLIRGGSPSEARSVAAAVVRELGARPAFVSTEALTGLGPWLTLLGLVPVFVCVLGPAERKVLPGLPGYRGPVLALAGPDGFVEMPEGAPATWRLGVPSAAEREHLWHLALGAEPGQEPLANDLARHYRHGTGRIAQLGRLARHQRALAGRPAVTRADLLLASWTGEAGGLESLAEPIRVTVPDEALVVAPELRTELESLVLRCRHREELITGLGTTVHARYRPGVRALFTGPSGAGKTLAAGWLATRLALPLFRVDLASVTSKYIGETEKNLAQLLAQAEQAEVILLFDEADSLFGKRTDIRDSNDRFANAQTNYLLQRIESYDGLVVLTSNSKARFDNAFARRLDCVLEFPLPSADERRDLWLAHLGAAHAVSTAELNRLAALADLAGGHIRNAVLSAALPARAAQRAITFDDCRRGLDAEYRKLGRHAPPGLHPADPHTG